MIMMEQPSFCVNSVDVPGPHYAMWRTVEAAEGTTSAQLVAQIIAMNTVALATENSPLRNIIINCHAYPGGLLIGGQGHSSVNIDNVGDFQALHNLNVGTIWLVACRAAFGDDGLRFCQALANAAGTQVIASDDYQSVTFVQTIRYYTAPSGQIDDYEGTVYSFTVTGGMQRGIDPEDVVWTVKT
jgi:hypothetical protein